MRLSPTIVIVPRTYPLIYPSMAQRCAVRQCSWPALVNFGGQTNRISGLGRKRPRALSEFPRPRETARNNAAGLRTGTTPVLQFGRRPCAAVGVAQTLFPCEAFRVDQRAVLVPLQDDAAPAREFGHFGQRKDQHLAILADDGDGIAFDKGADRGFC